MQRILIAEDEFLVRIGLKTTINWKKHGYVIVGEASNGKEALQMFADTNPDILITDIKMPMMDGLELLAEVKKRKPSIQVIILSNHDDFEYARASMCHGAARYLLKSEINEEVILGALETLSVGQVRPESDETTQKPTQERYLRRHVHSQLRFDNIALRATSDEWATFPANCYIAIRGDGEMDLSEEFDEDTAIKNIESLFGATFDNLAVCCSIVNNQLIITAIYSSGTDPAAELNRCMKKVDALIRNAKLYFDCDLHVGINQAAANQRVSAAFEQAETARLHCFFTGDRLALYGDFPEPAMSMKLRVDRGRMRERVLSRDQCGMEEYIESIFQKLRQKRDYNLLRAVFVELLSIFRSIRDDQGDKAAKTDSGDWFRYSDLDWMPTLRHVQCYILDIYRTLLETDSCEDAACSHAVRKCKQMLDERYAENLSLDSVAKAVGFSKSYLSMVFKQEMGINFSVYLTTYRIEKAKQLLVQTNMKIYEIAEKVGFSTPYYFSKVFKEQTGMSCKEYKDIHGN